MKTNRIIAVGETSTLEVNFDEEYDCTKEAWLRYCKETFPEERIKSVFDAKRYHICKYCGTVTKGTDEDILCEDCRDTFGHTFFSQL